MKRNIKFLLIGTLAIVVAMTVYAKVLPKHQCIGNKGCDMCDRR